MDTNQIIDKVINQNEQDEEDELEKEFQLMLLNKEQTKPAKPANPTNLVEPVELAKPVEPKVDNQFRPRIRPMVRNNVTGRFDNKFASASITFSHGKHGDLIANEYRWFDKYEDGKNQYHLIGGKVEASDIDILYTGIREFVEETNIFMDNSLVLNNDIKKISDMIYHQIKFKVKYYDIVVNPRTNLLHRCFIFNINKFTNMELRKKIIGLPKFYEQLANSNSRINTELNSLKWITLVEKEEISNENFSNLTLDYYLNINNFV